MRPLLHSQCVTLLCGGCCVSDWVLVNLLHQLHQLHYSSYHATFVQFLREPFLAFATAQAEFQSALATAQPAQITASIISSHHKRLDDSMARAWEKYSEAREFVYGMDSDVRHEQEGEEMDQGLGGGQGKKGRGGAEKAPTDEEGGEAMGLLTTNDAAFNPPHVRRRGRLYQSAFHSPTSTIGREAFETTSLTALPCGCADILVVPPPMYSVAPASCQRPRHTS